MTPSDKCFSAKSCGRHLELVLAQNQLFSRLLNFAIMIALNYALSTELVHTFCIAVLADSRELFGHLSRAQGLITACRDIRAK